MIIKRHNKYYSFWPIIKRHWKTTIPYLDIVKLCNIFLAIIEKKLGKIEVKSKPFFIKIEPTNRCNLRCTGCIHADGRTELQENNYLGDMDFNLFKKIINDLEKYLVKVSLYLVGEPLIYTRIIDMIKYLSDKKIGSVISSNFNYLTPQLAHDLVKNKLTHLIISMDGCNEISYQKYRRGGSFIKVVENLKMIQQEKKRQNSKYPLIEIQAIKFNYFTQAKIDKIAKLAKQLNADQFLVKENLVDHYKNPMPQNKKCFWLYTSPCFHWNGVIQPCCFFYEKKDNNFGDITKNNFKDIWNNKKYKTAREYFATGEKSKNFIRCYDCIFFKK